MSSSGGSSPERKVLNAHFLFFMVQSVYHVIFYIKVVPHFLIDLIARQISCHKAPPSGSQPHFVLLTQCFVGGGKRAVPSSVQGPTPAHVPSTRSYEHYHATLDQMAKPQPKVISREGSSAGPGSPIR